eukprot:TRINITY_DN14484_c0_g1_i2.p1 TRINITY_DN14484_c0_g1~~TRINITY_DN14484_c0_g1_i2.p1  ORF type:complete len:404 (-),score=50.98 TRINITY_DN14484_c0_g1_i2:142-1353(-)
MDVHRRSKQRGLLKAVNLLQNASKVMVLSGAGMSTAAGIPDFRSPGGLYGTSSVLLDRFTYVEPTASQQRQELEEDVKSALTLSLFHRNPLPYHEMRRGLIIGLGENQWKPTIGHVFPEILNRNGKLQMVASQNIDGLDHKVVSDKRKLYNPHGLMSWLVSEPMDEPLCTDTKDPIYQKYVELVKSNIKDIYSDRSARQGKSSHLWPGPAESKPITLEMFGELLPEKFGRARQKELEEKTFSVKPGSVLFDRTLWRINAAGEEYNAFLDVKQCDLMLVMGTSLSGLTIDQLAYDAADRETPKLVFDMTKAPVTSCMRNRAWKSARDCHLQGPIDNSILDILHELGWLNQLYDFLPHLCLGSLRTFREFVSTRVQAESRENQLQMIDLAIAEEINREKAFYGDE